MAGVHGLQHVERFLAADLTHDDPVRPHTQGVHDQVALPHAALAFDILRTCFEAYDVSLTEHQFGRILDRHDPLGVPDEAGEDVEERRLACTGAARDDDVQPAADCCLQEVEHVLRHRIARDEVLRSEPIGAKAANRHAGAVERERRDDGVHARAVLQTRVHHRARFVDAAADRADDPLDDLHQVPIVLEDDVGLFELAFALHVDLIRPVDENVRDRRVAQQRLERAEAEQLVEHVGHERLALEQAHRSGLLEPFDDDGNDPADFRFGLLALHAREPLQVQAVQQVLMDACLQMLVVLLARVRGTCESRGDSGSGSGCGSNLRYAHGFSCYRFVI